MSAKSATSKSGRWMRWSLPIICKARPAVTHACSAFFCERLTASGSISVPVILASASGLIFAASCFLISTACSWLKIGRFSIAK